MAIRLKVQDNSIHLKVADPDAKTFKASEGVPIYPSSYTGETDITPTEAVQTLETEGLMMNADVTVAAIPSDYVGSEIERRTSTDVTVVADTVTVPGGYYAEGAEKTVATGSAAVPTESITANPTISVASDGLITASVTKSETVSPIIQEGYIATGSPGTITFSGSSTSQLSTQGASTITPTENEQTAVTSGKYTTGTIKVGAISSDYIGSGVTRRSSSDLSASGKTVSVPSGYYEEAASNDVATGSASTPATSITATPSISVNSSGLITATASATKSVTPSVSEGYVSSGTAGTITVSGSNTSQLSTVSGTTITPTESEQTAVASGKYTTGAVKVGAISSSYVGSGITRRDSDDLSASGATVTAPSGYYAESATKTIASGSATPAASISATGAGKTVGNGTITLTKSAVSNTPQVTAGYISSGTAGNTSVSLTASVTTQAGQTLHPSTSDQSIAANTYVLGAQTFKAVTLSNLSAENIKDGVTVKVGDSTDDDCVASVTGNYSGGGTPTLQTKTKSYTPSETAQSEDVVADTGYDGLEKVSVSVGAISSTYVGTGVPRVEAAIIHPSTSDQTIATGTYIAGAQKFNKVTTTNLTAENIKAGVTVKVGDATDDDCVASILGTFSGGGGTGYTYETGEYKPTSDAARPTISFANSHSTTPFFVAMYDTSAASGITASSNTVFVFWDMYRWGGGGFPYSTSATRYAVAAYVYRSSNSSTLGSVQIQYNSDNTSTSTSSYSRYWANTSDFHPYSNSTSRYWRSGRTYKWVAVWK